MKTPKWHWLEYSGDGTLGWWDIKIEPFFVTIVQPSGDSYQESYAGPWGFHVSNGDRTIYEEILPPTVDLEEAKAIALSYLRGEAVRIGHDIDLASGRENPSHHCSMPQPRIDMNLNDWKECPWLGGYVVTHRPDLCGEVAEIVNIHHDGWLDIWLVDLGYTTRIDPDYFYPLTAAARDAVQEGYYYAARAMLRVLSQL